MISFFTSLKPFHGATAIQQRNALLSWRAAVPDSEIIVFGKTEGSADVLTEVNATYRSDIACNEFGTPLISAMFSEAQRIGLHSVLCYINGDIILLPDFAAAVVRLAGWRTFTAVGRRWDLDLDAPINVGKADWHEKLGATVAAHGRQHDAVAMDFFAFRRGAVGPLPEFAIGRPAWDNYLIKHLLDRHIPIVDISRAAAPIHQNHDYGHVAKRRGDTWEGPEADRNRRLATQEFGKFNPRYYTIKNAQWMMLGRFTVPAVTPRRLFWRGAANIPDAIRDVARTSLYYLRRSGPVLARFADLYGSTLLFRLLPRDRRRIAVVRLDNIGDFLLWLDGAKAIRARYPREDYHVTLIAPVKWSAFAESSGLFDEVIALDRTRFFGEGRYRRATCRKVARQRFVTVINPTFSRDTWVDDVLVKATGATTCIGHTGDLSNQPSRHLKRITDRWYTQLFSGAETATHELEKNWQFAKLFDPHTELRVPMLEPAMVSRPAWLPAGNDYFVLFPGAEATIRKWPIERFSEIAHRIHAKTGWSAIVCGLTSDSVAAKQLIAQATDVPILDACGRTSLQELAAIIKEAKLTVTNDTSAVHLAAALDRPAVVVLGGGHFGRFLPYPAKCGEAARKIHAAYHSMDCYQCNWRCVHQRQPNDAGPCIAAVTTEDVWTTIEPMLSRSHLRIE